jgi:hypothetical protein
MRLGALLRRPASRPRGPLPEAALGVDDMPRPEWMSEDAFQDFKTAYASSLAGRGTVIQVEDLSVLLDPEAHVPPEWISPGAFDRLKEARGQLPSRAGRGMAGDEPRAGFGLEAE